MQHIFSSSNKSIQFIRSVFSSSQEEFWAFALTSELRLIQFELLFRGSAYSCQIHPRDLIRFLCLSNAHAFVIAHNHPMGRPFPSSADRRITRQIVKVSQLIEIELLDHLIISKLGHFSFADAGYMKKMNSRILRDV